MSTLNNTCVTESVVFQGPLLTLFGVNCGLCCVQSFLT